MNYKDEWDEIKRDNTDKAIRAVIVFAVIVGFIIYLTVKWVIIPWLKLT